MMSPCSRASCGRTDRTSSSPSVRGRARRPWPDSSIDSAGSARTSCCSTCRRPTSAIGRPNCSAIRSADDAVGRVHRPRARQSPVRRPRAPRGARGRMGPPRPSPLPSTALERLRHRLDRLDPDLLDFLVALAVGFSVSGPALATAPRFADADLRALMAAARATGMVSPDGSLLPDHPDHDPAEHAGPRAVADAARAGGCRRGGRRPVGRHGTRARPSRLPRPARRRRRCSAQADEALPTEPVEAWRLYAASIEAGGDMAALAGRRAQAAWAAGDIRAAERLVDGVLTGDRAPRPPPGDERRGRHLGTEGDAPARRRRVRQPHRGGRLRGRTARRLLPRHARRGRAGPGHPGRRARRRVSDVVPGGDLADGRRDPHRTRRRTRPRAVGAAPGLERHGRVRRGHPAARGAGRPRRPRRAQRRRAGHRGRRAPAPPSTPCRADPRSGTGFDSREALVALRADRPARARSAPDGGRVLAAPTRAPRRGARALRTDRARSPHRRARRPSCGPGSLRARRSRHMPIDLTALPALAELTIAAARLHETAFHRGAGRQRPGRCSTASAAPRPGRPTSTGRNSRRPSCAAIDRTSPRTSTALPDAGADRIAWRSRLAEAGRVWSAALAGDVDVHTVERAVRDLAASGYPWDAGRLAGHAAGRAAEHKDTLQLLALARGLHPEEQRPTRRGHPPRSPRTAPATTAG